MSIAGYTFTADTFCDGCIVEAMIGVGVASPAARDMARDDVFDQCAQAQGIADYTDERTFDTAEFPKVIFSWDLDGVEFCGMCERCLGCGHTVDAHSDTGEDDSHLQFNCP